MMTLNHGFSGYVCGRAAMPLLRRYTPLPEGTLALAFFLGAMLPDLDAVTTLIGPSLYFSAEWYGHRQAFHSILGTFLLALLASLPFAYRQSRRGGVPWREAYGGLVTVFWMGGLLHILGDLFTPRLPMPLFWPLPPLVGAFSHIGWFSPFLLWLFLGALVTEALIRWLPGRRAVPARWRAAAIWGVHAFAAWRWIDYLLRSRYHSPAQWAAYQHSLLPEAMIGPVDQGVRELWFWMVR
jgi:membrane-bound metal-dependent hydrolase YbcI (DUF457 family)